MSNSFLFAFTVTAVLTAGAVDFVNQTKVTGGIGVQEYFAALPGRLGGQKSAPEIAAPAEAVAQPSAKTPSGQTVDQEALRQKLALAASQIEAASAAAQASQPADPAAATGAASFLGALLKGVGKAAGQSAPAAQEPIKPAQSTPTTVKVNAIGLGGCASSGSGKRCKVGG